MTAETIDHHTLSRLVEAGAVHDAHVIGQVGGWGVLIQDGIFKRYLTASRSNEHLFDYSDLIKVINDLETSKLIALNTPKLKLYKKAFIKLLTSLSVINNSKSYAHYAVQLILKIIGNSYVIWKSMNETHFDRYLCMD